MIFQDYHFPRVLRVLVTLILVSSLKSQAFLWLKGEDRILVWGLGVFSECGSFHFVSFWLSLDGTSFCELSLYVTWSELYVLVRS